MPGVWTDGLQWVRVGFLCVPPFPRKLTLTLLTLLTQMVHLLPQLEERHQDHPAVRGEAPFPGGARLTFSRFASFPVQRPLWC